MAVRSVWNTRVRKLFVFRRTTYSRINSAKIKEVIHSYLGLGHLSHKIKYFRPVMEEPSFMLAADSDVDELDLQKVMSKIRRKMKRKLQQQCEDLVEVKRSCVDVDSNVQIQSELTDSVLRCENGRDTGSHSCDSQDQSTNVDVTSSPTDVTEISHASSGGTGNKKVKRKRKLPSRLERILKHHLNNTIRKSTSTERVIKPDNKCSSLEMPSLDQYLALDCEFVGVGAKGCISKLGRCSIVDYHGNIVYDMYSRPEEPITDYRTRFSGLTCRHLINGVPFEVVQEKAKDLLKDKILVGHDIKQDLRVLQINHPAHRIRDTYTHPSVKKKAKDLGCDRPALKNLSWCLLGRRIQTITHCSVEDATATMDLFKLVRVEWEKSLNHHNSDVYNEAGVTSDPEHIGTEKDSVLSEYLDDKFWPEDDKVNDQSQFSSDDLGNLPNSDGPKVLNPAAALNEVAQKLRWELPEYHFERPSSSEYPPKFVCKVLVNDEEYQSKVLVNDEEYQSTSCSSKKEAKAAAAEAFFVHHRKSENDTYMDVLKHLTENTESVNQTDQRLHPVVALNEVAQKLRWELPEYQYECLSSEYPPKFVCKVLVNDEEYQSTSCSSKKEAKTAAAEAFFVHHRKSENDTYMDVLKLLKSENNQTDPS